MNRHYTDEHPDNERRPTYPAALYLAIQPLLLGTGETIEDALYEAGFHLDEFDDEHIAVIRQELEEFYKFRFNPRKEVWSQHGNAKPKVRLPLSG
jgi:hypothetical protein